MHFKNTFDITDKLVLLAQQEVGSRSQISNLKLVNLAQAIWASSSILPCHSGRAQLKVPTYRPDKYKFGKKNEKNPQTITSFPKRTKKKRRKATD